MPIYKSFSTRHSMALAAATGLFALLIAPAVQAQSTEGVARISDRNIRQVSQTGCDSYGAPACANEVAPPPPVEASMPPAAPGCDGQMACQAPVACQQPCGQCCEQCNQCDCPAFVHEGCEHCLTGNPIVDWCTVHKMKCTSAIMCHFYNCKAKHKLKECEEECEERNERCQKCKNKRSCFLRGRCNNGCGNGCNGGCNNGCSGDCNDGCNNGCGCCNLRNFPYPEGCGGRGCAIVDKYSMVYATMPEYADPRDGRVYAHEGYNVPVAMPLAPNVHYQYNYGWGIPSSRITPISRFIPEGQYVRP